MFKKNQYDLDSKNFLKLVSLAKMGKIIFTTTDITMLKISGSDQLAPVWHSFDTAELIGLM